MAPSKRARATAADVECEAARYIVHELGDQLWAGDPTYDARHEQWTVPLHARSLPADEVLGRLSVDAQGRVVRAPARRTLQRKVQRAQPQPLPPPPDPGPSLEGTLARGHGGDALLSPLAAQERLRRVTFKVRIEKNPHGACEWGTGFFISPDGYALTAFHNLPQPVKDAEGGTVDVSYKDAPYTLECLVSNSLPESHGDIAVLHLPNPPADLIECVPVAYLDPALPRQQRMQFWAGRPVCIFGFPFEQTGQAERCVDGNIDAGQPLVEVDEKASAGWGPTIETKTERLRFLGLRAEALEGISGAPLLDRQTGTIVGVQGSYDPDLRVVYGTEIAALLARWPALRQYARPFTEPPPRHGPLPPVWNIQRHRNPHFTGRTSLLEALWTAFTSGPPVVRQQVLSGLGGVGKTQLAVEYAYRHAVDQQDYTVVWWVHAEEATLAADYAGLYVYLDQAQRWNGPQPDATDQTRLGEAVRAWLERNTGWLLIFDDAPTCEALRDYLPRGQTGHVLITSRNPHTWEHLARSLPVPVLERNAAVAFLLHRTQQTDKDAASALAAALSDLPLVLETAGAYIQTHQISLAEYLQRCTDPDEFPELLRHPLPDYPAPVAVTWELAFQRVQQVSEAGAALLQLCALLAPEDIPHALLRAGSQHLPGVLAAAVARPMAFDAAIAALRRYSLLERAGDALSVHPVVQAVVYHRLPAEDKRAWAEVAVRLVNSAFPFHSNEVRTWPECARLLPHALAAIKRAEELQVALDATGRLLNQTALYLHRQGRLPEARAACHRAVVLGEEVYGPTHPTVVIRRNNLGMILRALGELHEAQQQLAQALESGEEVYGPTHPTVASCHNNLGNVLRDLNRPAEARLHFERALAIDQARWGSADSTVATDLCNLGMALRALGDLEGARARLTEALAIDRRARGSADPTVATDLSNFGLILKDLNDFEGARACLAEALAIDRRALGPVHHAVGRDLNNLGLVLWAQGEPQKARRRFVQARGIFRAVFGLQHPLALLVQHHLDTLARGGEPAAAGALPAGVWWGGEPPGSDVDSQQRQRAGQDLAFEAGSRSV
jgi:tetratricopeptide (TPR) repeat protein